MGGLPLGGLGLGGTIGGKRLVVFGSLLRGSSVTSRLSSVDDFLFQDNVL